MQRTEATSRAPSPGLKRKQPGRQSKGKRARTRVSYKEDSDDDRAGAKKGDVARDEANDPCYVPPDGTGSEAEKKACRKRDLFRCIIMHTAAGEVAHILPWSWNSKESSMQITKALIPGFIAFFDPITRARIHSLLCSPEQLCKSDKRWNMIYLNAQLHSWLSKAFFGLKCLGMEPSKDTKESDDPDKTPYDVIIQFNWFRRRWEKSNIPMSLEGEGEENDFITMVDEQIRYEDAGCPKPAHTRGGLISATNENTHMPVLSGHTFKVTMPIEEAKNFKCMLDVQWALGRIAAMSGAAEYPDSLPDGDDWDEIKQRTAVADWIEDLPG